METNDNLNRNRIYFKGHCRNCKFDYVDSEEEPCLSCEIGNTNFVKNNPDF